MAGWQRRAHATDRVRRMVAERFEYVVACQMYGEQRRAATVHDARDLDASPVLTTGAIHADKPEKRPA